MDIFKNLGAIVTDLGTLSKAQLAAWLEAADLLLHAAKAPTWNPEDDGDKILVAAFRAFCRPRG